VAADEIADEMTDEMTEVTVLEEAASVGRTAPDVWSGGAAVGYKQHHNTLQHTICHHWWRVQVSHY